MQCFISITAARWNIVRARSKRSIAKQDSLHQETGRAKSSRYLILFLKGKTCVSFRPEYGHNGFA